MWGVGVSLSDSVDVAVEDGELDGFMEAFLLQKGGDERPSDEAEDRAAL